MQKLRGRGQQFLFRQVCVSVCHGLQQGIINSAANAKIRIRENANLLGDLICHLKSDALNVVCQPIGIFADDPIHAGAVFIIDFQSQVHGYAVFLQKHHGLAHLFFGLHLFCNGASHLFADSLYLRQTLRFLLDNAKGIRLEAPHDAGSQGASDAADRTGAQVTFHRCHILRCLQFVGFHLDLISVNGMLHFPAGSLYEIPLTDIRKGSHQYIIQAFRADT